MLLAGLDIETTGLNITYGHRLIQIGIHVWDTETNETNTYGYDVQPIGKMVIDPDALKVNGFTKKRIKKAPTQDRIDTILWQDLLRDYKMDTLIPVGWNVINFDMPFIKKELSLTSLMFTYPTPQRSTRAIDLTALGLFVAHQYGKPYDKVKRDMRDEVAKRLGVNLEHDAIYDAKAAIEAFQVFNEMLEVRP